MKLSETTPIENIVPADQFSREYLGFSFSLPRPRDLVQLHKACLGRQTTTFQGEYRMWVWVRPTWTVYVSSIKGICFEVPEGTSVDAAWAAWREYLRAMTAAVSPKRSAVAASKEKT